MSLIGLYEPILHTSFRAIGLCLMCKTTVIVQSGRSLVVMVRGLMTLLRPKKRTERGLPKPTDKVETLLRDDTSHLDSRCHQMKDEWSILDLAWASLRLCS